MRGSSQSHALGRNLFLAWLLLTQKACLFFRARRTVVVICCSLQGRQACNRLGRPATVQPRQASVVMLLAHAEQHSGCTSEHNPLRFSCADSALVARRLLPHLAQRYALVKGLIPRFCCLRAVPACAKLCLPRSDAPVPSSRACWL